MSTVERHGLRLVTDRQADPHSGDAPRGIEDFGFDDPVTSHPALARLANIHRDVERSFRRIAACEAPSAQPGGAVDALTLWRPAARRAFAGVAAFSIFANLLILTMPVYLFQMADHVLSGSGIDLLLILPGLTLGVVAAMSMLDILRRRTLGRVGASMEAILGGAILSAMLGSAPERDGAHVQTLRDLHKVRGFLASPTMLFLFDVPLTPFFFGVVFLINPRLGAILVIAVLVVLGVGSLKRIKASSIARMLAAVAIVGWAAHLLFAGTLSVGMMIAASIITGRTLQSFEGAIEGWESLTETRAAYMRVLATLKGRQLPSTDGGLCPAPVLLATNVVPMRNSAAKRRQIAMSC